MLCYKKNRYQKNSKTQYDDTFLHFPFKAAVVARQADINIASEWGAPRAVK